MPSKQSATGGHADLIFEVAPNRDVFDTVRRAVVVTLRGEHGDVFDDDVREHVKIHVVDIDPSDWRVEGTLNDGHDIGFDVSVPAHADATADVLTYLRDRVDARYGGHVDADVVVFDEVSIRPNAWFVDAKIPPSP